MLIARVLYNRCKKDDTKKVKMDKNKQILSKETLQAASLASDFDSSVDPGAVVSPPKLANDLPVHAAPVSGGAANTPKPEVVTATSSSNASPLSSNWREALKPYAQKRFVQIGLAVSGLTFIIAVGVAIGLFVLAKKPQLIADSSKLDQSTLYIDSNSHSVGVGGTKSPSGLQVGSTVSSKSQGSANIRMGLVNGTDPSLVFEDSKANNWQILGADNSLQFVQGTQTRAKLDGNALSLTNALNVGGATNANGGLATKGNSTLGDTPASTLTIQGTTIAIPNNLNIGSNSLYINAANGTVAVGAANSGGYKLLVAGSLKANGSIYTDGQVLAAAGSAKNPSFAFTNQGSTGLYEPGLNVVGITAGGVQVVQVQQGSLITVNGANIEASGYLRGGRAANNPAFQVMRFTGTLDGSGAAVVNDGLSTGYAKVLVIQAFYQGGSGNAMSLNVDYVNSGNFQISGGTPGRPFRASMIYSQDNAGW